MQRTDSQEAAWRGDEKPMPKMPDPVEQAMRVVAAHFDVSVADIRSQRRSSAVHTARTWGMYLACESGASVEAVATAFNRDHPFVRAVARNRARDVSDSRPSARLLKELKSYRMDD
jgi:chromosomal replication initiation ATPase DnaA